MVKYQLSAIKIIQQKTIKLNYYKMRKRILFLTLCYLFSALIGVAQGQTNGTATGQVKDSEGKILPGVTVAEKGMPGNGAITDVNGDFKLKLKGTSNTITISLIGFKRQELKVTDKPITVILQIEENSLSDVVVVGYQKQNRREVTAAISSLNGKDIANIPEASFDQMLQGRLAGVSVLSRFGRAWC